MLRFVKSTSIASRLEWEAGFGSSKLKRQKTELAFLRSTNAAERPKLALDGASSSSRRTRSPEGGAVPLPPFSPPLSRSFASPFSPPRSLCSDTHLQAQWVHSAAAADFPKRLIFLLGFLMPAAGGLADRPEGYPGIISQGSPKRQRRCGSERQAEFSRSETAARGSGNQVRKRLAAEGRE